MKSCQWLKLCNGNDWNVNEQWVKLNNERSMIIRWNELEEMLHEWLNETWLNEHSCTINEDANEIMTTV